MTMTAVPVSSLVRDAMLENLTTLPHRGTQSKVEHFERRGGRYLTWRTERCGSMRFKVAYVRAAAGLDAVVSALFID